MAREKTVQFRLLMETQDSAELAQLADNRPGAPSAAPPIFHSQAAVAESTAVDRRPRRMTNEAWTATEQLVHAMEYLADSRELPDGNIFVLCPTHPDVQALELMMEAKHQVYLNCPLIERRKGLSGLFKGRERRGKP